MSAPAARLDLARLGQLTFQEPDLVRFPALRLAREALVAGGSAPVVLNAANEAAVEAFLAGRLGFLEIARIVEKTLTRLPARAASGLDDVLAVDAAARRVADELMGGAVRAAAAGE
jgi:1-deoxy-D-xylulose-5-phosphate reductoisomerase